MAVSKKNVNKCMKCIIMLHDYISEMLLFNVNVKYIAQLISTLYSMCALCEEEKDIVVIPKTTISIKKQCKTCF